ncbi:MAG: site-specific integrase [Acidobacteria bacterium]|nr:site-specific integrase [Acidobacteriota bacterium]
MPRTRTGSVTTRKIKNSDGTTREVVIARLCFTDADGKYHDYQKRAENKTEARRILDKMRRSIETHGQLQIDAERMTFEQLAQWYEKNYAVPAKFDTNGQKVHGLKSHKDVIQRLHALREYFGKKRIRSITFTDLENFKRKRLQIKTFRGQDRKIATVNRELAVLRRIFRLAFNNRWLLDDPFDRGDKALISTAVEIRREKLINRDEERQLLAACVDTRAHMRPLIIAALDTGCREGELLRLKWADIDFETRTIRVLAQNSKTLRARQVPISTRLIAELEQLHQEAADKQNGLVFGRTSHVKWAWDKVRQAAGLPDLRFHDLRHVAATRLAQGGLHPFQVAAILGHTDPKTTYRYFNLDQVTLQTARSVLDTLHGKPIGLGTERKDE